MKTILFAILSCLLILSSSAQAIIDGTYVDPGVPLAKSTVSVFIHISLFPSRHSICSGTILSPRKILTAGHCVIDTSKASYSRISARRMKVYFGNVFYETKLTHLSITTQATSIQVKSVDLHPQFKKDPPSTEVVDSMNHNDLAILTLEEDIPQSAQKANILADDIALRSGDQVGLAGYGATGWIDDGHATLREVDGLISSDQRVQGLTHIEKLPQVRNGGACHGDSGGPAFLTHDNVNYVWGVASRADCLGTSFYTDLRPYRAWIQSVIDKK